ncbi:M28 family peptidase [Parasphingopyxis sp.]|uniref:M28 family peptidase n=1 Tax=Parasphingopyxis sp. TaxID=1920299 RepID=UPI002625327D|nr:M28 family peptidase [Parasphingopyxis sp.]
MRHIEILASDEFEGREPGTAGEALAVSYIATELSAAGLMPGYNGHYFQPVALVSRFDGRSELRVTHAGGERSASAEVIAFGSRETVDLNTLPVIFVGHALGILADDGDAFADSRFDGQAVLLLRGDRGTGETAPSFRRSLAFFRDRGAAAIIGIAERGTPWDASLASMRFRQTYRAQSHRADVEGIVSAETTDLLFGEAGYPVERLFEMAAADDFQPMALPVELNVRTETLFDRYDGINVVALLPGTGDTDDTVMFTAHHDHFGICRPEGAEDRICNGAIDNASGIAALIETARALAAGPRPERDIMFVTTTAEESGLLGAFAFVEAPPRPLEQIIALFNLDSIAIAPRGMPVGIIGRGLTPLDALIDGIAREQGRDNYTGAELDAYVRRLDSWAFLANGVPALAVGGSFADPELLNGFLRGVYHSPDDEIEGMELGGALDDLLLHIALGRAFADPARYPTPQR